MTCDECDGLVLWCGPLSALTHTECQSCGAIDSQSMDGEFGEYEDEEDDEEQGLTDADRALIAAATKLYWALDQAVTSLQDSGYRNKHVTVMAAKQALAEARGENNDRLQHKNSRSLPRAR